MKKKILCTALAVMMLLSQTASATPWRINRNQIVFDNELGIRGIITLRFATETGSYIRPVTKLYGTKISLEEYVPIREGYTFAGWFSDPRTKQNQVKEFTFTRHDVVYAKWEKVNGANNIKYIYKTLDKHPSIKNIICCLDNDEKGIQATNIIKRQIINNFFDLRPMLKELTQNNKGKLIKDWNEALPMANEINIDLEQLTGINKTK